MTTEPSDHTQSADRLELAQSTANRVFKRSVPTSVQPSHLRNWKSKLDFRPRFTAALAKREWIIYPFFAFLVLVFLLLLPRACRYP